MASLNLDTIPQEVLQKILLYGNCKSALALSMTNKTLHTRCYNKFTFQKLIKHGYVELCAEGKRILNNPERWTHVTTSQWNTAHLGPDASTTQWARWALADWKAVQFAWYILSQHEAKEHFEQSLFDPRGFLDTAAAAFPPLSNATLEWLPALYVTRHPVVPFIPIETLIFTFGRLRKGMAPIRRLTRLRNAEAFAESAFCLALRNLDMHCCECRTESSVRALGQHVYSIRFRPLFRDLEDYATVHHLGAPSPSSMRAKVMCAHGLASGATVAISHQVAYCYQEHQNFHTASPNTPLPEYHSFQDAVIPRPPSAIPFQSLLRLPAPFPPARSDAGPPPATCHLAALTAPAFLADGAWTGYQLAHLGLPHPDDRAPHELRFDARDGDGPLVAGVPAWPSGRPRPADRGRAPGSVAVWGRGRLGGGSFVVTGTLCRDTGWVHLRRSRDDGRAAHYTGVMTPFGIVGTWGVTTPGVPGKGLWGEGETRGWFWLFKESWTRAWPETRVFWS